MPLTGIFVTVNNENGTCGGGLKAKVTREIRGVFEPAIAAPGEIVNESISAEQEGFHNPFGSDNFSVTVTTWCYDNGGKEIGYNEEMLSVHASYGTGHIGVIPEADLEDVYIDAPSFCKVGEDATGTPVCIFEGP